MPKDAVDHLTGVVICGRCDKRFTNPTKWRIHVAEESEPAVMQKIVQEMHG